MRNPDQTTSQRTGKREPGRKSTFEGYQRSGVFLTNSASANGIGNRILVSDLYMNATWTETCMLAVDSSFITKFCRLLRNGPPSVTDSPCGVQLAGRVTRGCRDLFQSKLACPPVPWPSTSRGAISSQRSWLGRKEFTSHISNYLKLKRTHRNSFLVSINFPTNSPFPDMTIISILIHSRLLKPRQSNMRGNSFSDSIRAQ